MATVWRLQGIETHGGDLALTRLALGGEDGLLSDGAAVTASHAPVEGDLSTLAAGGTACLWPQEVVQSPGIWSEMTCLSDAEAWAARFMPVSVLSGVAHYSLTTLRSGRRVCAALGRVPATAGEWSVAPTRSAALDVLGGVSIPSMASTVPPCRAVDGYKWPQAQGHRLRSASFPGITAGHGLRSVVRERLPTALRRPQ